MKDQPCPIRVERGTRVVIAISRPVDRDEWARFWKAAQLMLGDPSRNPTGKK